MRPLKIFLVFSIICSFSTIKVESVYSKFFKYGDKNEDGEITVKEAEDNPNMAFLYEWEEMWKQVPKEIRDRGKITYAELRDMSIPGGSTI